MSFPLCRHIRTNGLRCKAAALTGGFWCYFHQNLHQSHQVFRHNEAARGYLIPGQHVELTTLEDRDSVQLALSIVINALATGQLETRRATALLYGLQVASANAVNLDLRPSPSEVVRTFEPTAQGDLLAEPAIQQPLLFEPGDDEDDEEDDEDDEDDCDDDEGE
jgi:hypothetical protein